jgi:hypothetical protein
LDALLANATKRPFALIVAQPELPFAATPVGPSARLTRRVVLSSRSRTNTLVKRLSSSAASPSAFDMNTT